jgi:redox-sensing transcriptional repressor
MRRISDSTIHRLSVYYRLLSNLEKQEVETVSSAELAELEDLTPAQVRKDLSFFGSFGTRGLGYPVSDLKQKIAQILGIDREWKVGLVGVGNVGSALVRYKEFARQGFSVVALFDSDQRKIGSEHLGVAVSDVSDMEIIIRDRGVEMMIIAVPSSAAQAVAERIVSTGVRAILNFAPINLKVPEDVFVRSENMSIELEYLSFRLSNGMRR